MTIEHGKADFGGGILNQGSGWNEGDSVVESRMFGLYILGPFF
jgi:hypothetical protein